jgi:8-oxo-dGTP pyrophosphatase MutT (NUDIX family)
MLVFRVGEVLRAAVLVAVELMSGAIVLTKVRAVLATSTAAELQRAQRAAVSLVLSEHQGQLSVLLVRRAEREGDPWSGHMALPGGHEHPTDRDLLHTAQRETLEEVGLDLEQGELLGRLDDVSPMRSSAMVVRPFVFWLPHVPSLSTSNEIAEVLWVSLADLASDNLRATREVELAATRLSVPAFVIGERVVWGMTFHLLERFLAQILRAP